MAGAASENTIRDSAAKRYEQLGCWVVKTTRLTPGRSGIPDMFACDPVSGGHFIALEFKKPINPALLKASQVRELAAIEKAGGTSAVVNSVEQALDVLRKVRAQRARS